MRSEVYFLPPRTSVTDSVGISTLPILSCSPNAVTRDSRDSFTLRSNPEYEWMMYHFIFGLRGASVEAAAPSAAAVCGSPTVLAAASFFSWSCIIKVLLPGQPLANLEIVEQRGYAMLNNEVDHEEVQRKNSNRDHNYGRRRPNFLPRRRSHLAHFGAYVVVEGSGAFRPGLYRRYECVLFRHGRHLLPSTSFFSTLFLRRAARFGP